MRDRFDDWLSRELDARLRPAAIAPSPAARYAQPRRRRGPVMLVRGLVATTGAKLAVGGILAASAAGVTGLAVTHHSTAPTPHPSMPAAVEACKDLARPAGHGIGPCVSADAGQHVGDRRTAPGAGHRDPGTAGRGGSENQGHDGAAVGHDTATSGPAESDRVGPSPDSGHRSPSPSPSATSAPTPTPPDRGSDATSPAGHGKQGAHQ